MDTVLTSPFSSLIPVPRGESEGAEQRWQEESLLPISCDVADRSSMRLVLVIGDLIVREGSGLIVREGRDLILAIAFV